MALNSQSLAKKLLGLSVLALIFIQGAKAAHGSESLFGSFSPSTLRSISSARSRLDAIGVTLYPPSAPTRTAAAGSPRCAPSRRGSTRWRREPARSVIVGEIGLRSARGAAAKPWESAEERASPPDPLLQAEVLADWLGVLDRPAIGGVLIWRWFTDPDAGGLADTDFTVQGKPAEGVLLCAWTAAAAAETHDQNLSQTPKITPFSCRRCGRHRSVKPPPCTDRAGVSWHRPR